MGIENAARRYNNIDVTTAYMPEPFGTHHSKMIVLFRHDDLAQIVILTGNFIERDWCMSQAIWQSPLLPFLRKDQTIDNWAEPISGSGRRFKQDLLAYIKSYGGKLKKLEIQLSDFDFAEVKAALIASTPGKQTLQSTDPENETLWGWPGLKHILSHVPQHKSPDVAREVTTANTLQQEAPHIAIQVSSIASLGTKWLKTVLFPSLKSMKNARSQILEPAVERREDPRFSIVFPTPETIRKSVNGYASGASIHMKTQAPAQAKQLADLRPMLCHWAGSVQDSKLVRAARYATANFYLTSRIVSLQDHKFL